MHQDDTALIEAFQAGDEFAFVTLYNRYKAPVFAFTSKMLLDRDAAQDVTQETFIRVYENRDRLLRSGAFKSWLFTIARNQCLNYLRRTVRQETLDHDVPLPAGEGTGAQYERNEAVQLVNRVLAALKPDYREIIVLREYQNLNYEEIAAVTRSTVSAVKSKLFKARRKMAELVQAHTREAAPASPF